MENSSGVIVPRQTQYCQATYETGAGECMLLSVRRAGGVASR